MIDCCETLVTHKQMLNMYSHYTNNVETPVKYQALMEVFINQSSLSVTPGPGLVK